MMSNVWFDRENVTPDAPEHNDSMEEMCREISKMIEVEVEWYSETQSNPW